MIEIEVVSCILFIQLQYVVHILFIFFINFTYYSTDKTTLGPFSKPLAGSYYSLPFLTTGKGLSCNSDLR